MNGSLKLRAPQGTSSVTLGGVEYPVGADGLVDVPGIFAATAAEHGFTVYTPPAAAPAVVKAEFAPASESEPDDTIPAPTDEALMAMDKGQLRDWLKSRGVAVAPNTKEPRLLNIAKDEAAALREIQAQAAEAANDTGNAGNGTDTLGAGGQTTQPAGGAQ